MLTAPLQSCRETASPDGAMVATVSRSLAGPTIADIPSTPANVRFWGVKRTCPGYRGMSAYSTAKLVAIRYRKI